MAKRILDHTSIRISSVERSRQFYEGVLGLAPDPRPDLGLPGMWYGLGDGQLHLIERQGTAAGNIDPTDPHFAIAVEDLDAMRRHLQTAGITMVDFGGQQIWIHDPDGNTVEICAAGARRR